MTVLATKQKIGLVSGPLLFIITFYFSELPEMNDAARGMLASSLWIAVWWMTEAIPISATALLPIVLFPFSGGLAIKPATMAYAHPLNFLFVGGLMIAIAIERWDLHRRIALTVIHKMGTESRKIILGFMIATGGMSMWISNTATAVMMMPIGMAVIHRLTTFLAAEDKGNGQAVLFGKSLMLSIAYAASIGGMATLIGTAPNVVFAGVIKDLYQYEISFSQWMSFGFPAAAMILTLCWFYMTRYAFPISIKKIPGSKEVIEKELQSLGKMSAEEKRVAGVFLLTALAWIARSSLLKHWIPGIDDTVIAIAGAILLFLIPAKQEKRMLLTWEEAVKLPWGVILILGAGFSLAAGFQSSGLAAWIGERMNMLADIPLFLVLLVIIAAINFLTELTSNTSTTSIMLPVMASLALAIGAHPFGLMVGTCLAASCAFMLPVATPPNAIVFGSGLLQMGDMVRAGVWMNLMTIFLLAVIVYFLLPLIWGIDLQGFPAGF